MKNKTSVLFLVLQLTLAYTHINAQLNLEFTEIDTSTIISGLDTPWEIAWGPDDHIWFTERKGLVGRVDPESGSSTTVLDITDSVYQISETGLLGMAFHPDFELNPWVYLVYNYRLPDNSETRERLVRYSYLDGSLIDPYTLLEGLSGSENHNGSRLAFGPDTTLYMTTGDVQNASLAQDYASLSGKVLRINPDGSIPSDNPDPESYIWSIGHRNPQGLVFSTSGLLYSSEHGPSNDDELNIIEEGRNYGWPDVEGFCNNSSESVYCADYNIREPLIAWTPTLAVAGIDYYMHPAIPEWQHAIIMVTLKADRFVVLRLSVDGLSIVEEQQYFIDWWGRLRDVCVSPDGRIFLAVSNKDGRGQVRPGDDRIIELKSRTPNADNCEQNLAVDLCLGDSIFLQHAWQKFSGTYRDTIPGTECDIIRITELTLIPLPELNLPEIIQLDQTESYTFKGLGGFTSYEWNDNPELDIPDLKITAGQLETGEYTYTLRVENASGCVAFDTCRIIITSTSRIETKSPQRLKVYPNPVRDEKVFIEGNWKGDMISVRLFDQLGKLVIFKEFSNANMIEVMLDIEPGIYVLETRDIAGIERIRLIVN